MKITPNMIDKELRLKGKFLKPFTNYKSKKNFEINNKLINLLYKNNKSKKMICDKVYITKRDGNKVRACIYRPLNQKSNAVGLLWLHGGGYGMCIPEQDITYYENFMKVENCIIVAPDYTHSVDSPYPSAFNDCYEVLYWMKQNVNKLGIKDNQLFVGGESAGGGLTAALSLYARDKKEVNIAFQMPLYPMIDDRMITNSSQYDVPIWNSKSNYLGWKLYLGNLFKSDNVPKYAAPSREINYLNLPPTFTFVGDIYPFYDETIEYINNLKKAGVKTSLFVYKGCYHGFDTVCPNATKSRHATNELLKAFRYACDNYFYEQPKI